MGNALNVGIGRRQFIAGAAAGGLFLSIAPTCQAFTNCKAFATESSQSFTAGTYTATAMGRKGPVGVEVTFSDDRIESIEVIESHETPRIAAAAFDGLIPTILEYQTLGLDTVTGATFSSMALLNAVEECAKQAGADLDALATAPGPDKTTAEETIDCDVLVIGSGSAGTVAAMEAALQGAKVVVMEKSSNIGGNALVCGGVLDWLNAPEEYRPEMTEGYEAFLFQTLEQAKGDFGAPQEAIDEVLAEYEDHKSSGSTKVFDSGRWEYLYGRVASGGTAKFDQDAFDTSDSNIESNHALFDWLNQTNIEWKSPLIAVAGYPWPTCTSPVKGECGAGYFLAFEDYIVSENLPIDFLMATPATELTTSNGRVVGAKGTCVDGTTYTVNASKAVILATGGFSGSPELLKRYGAEWEFDTMDFIPTDNAYGHTGDGLALAQGTGSATPEEHSVYVMILPFANAVDYSVESIVGDSGNALLVNKEAKRFVDECQGRNYITRYEMEQPDQMCYLISDVNTCLFENGMNMFGIEEEMLLLQKKCYKADTIADLANQIGLDPDTLEETISTFNGYVDAGQDPDFGRTMFNENSKVLEPPFYACPCHWAVHITGTLVATDSNGAVLDVEGNPIAGLYSIGEVSGNSGITNMAEAIEVANAIVTQA